MNLSYWGAAVTGRHCASNASCLMWPHLLLCVVFIVSRTLVICCILCHF